MRFGPAGRGLLPFTVDGDAYALDLPDGPTLAAVAAFGQWPRIMPGMLAPDSRAAIDNRLRDPRDPLGMYACWRIFLGLAPEIFGMEWWAAQRLCATAQSQWTAYESWSVTVGFDPATAPAHRICSAAWAWLRASCQDEKDFRKLEADILHPPPALRRSGAARPRGFSDAEMAAQAQQLAALTPADGGYADD